MYSQLFLVFGEAVTKFVDSLASLSRQERSSIKKEPLPQEAKSSPAIHDPF